MFKKKRNGVFRARICTLGYNQVPGVDFTANYAPDITDVSFCVILVMASINNLKLEVFNVEMAFLYAKLKELVYMHIPKGYTEVTGDEDMDIAGLILYWTFYGLMQAARECMFQKQSMSIEKGRQKWYCNFGSVCQ